MKCVHVQTFGGNPEGKRPSARARNRWEDSINKGRRGVVYFVLGYGKWLNVVSILMVKS